MRTRLRRRGTSLVEVLVVVSLVATAVLAAAAAVIESSALQRVNAQTRAMTPYVASLLDEVRGADFTNLLTTYGDVTRTVDVPGAPTNGSARIVTTAIDTGSTRWLCRKVVVTLSWTGPSGPVSITGTTYVADRSIVGVSGGGGED